MEAIELAMATSEYSPELLTLALTDSVSADNLASQHPHVYLQGYYFGIPQPIEDFLKHLT